MGTFGWGKVQKVTSAPPPKKTKQQSKTKQNMKPTWKWGKKLKFDKVPLEHSPSKESNLAH